MFEWIRYGRKLNSLSIIGGAFALTMALWFSVATSFAAIENNKILSMRMDSTEEGPTLRILTEKPVGYRYTVYFSNALNCVVINFPHMDLGAISSLINVDQPPVQKVDVSSHDTVAGRLGRVDVMLSQAADYDINVHDNEFVLILLPKETQFRTAAGGAVLNKTGPADRPVSETALEPMRTSTVVPEPELEITTPAGKITNIDIGTQDVTLQADGFVDSYKFFRLGDPERLVVDVYGVTPGFEERSFPLPMGFDKMRVGVYQEKLRFVFDATGNVPQFAVTRKGESVVVSWGADTSTAPNQVQ